MNTPKLKVGDTVFINDSYHADEGHPYGTFGVIVGHDNSGGFDYEQQLFRLSLRDENGGGPIKEGWPHHYTLVENDAITKPSIPKGFAQHDLLNLANDLEAQPAFIDGGKEDGKRVQIESNSAFAARFIRAVLENSNANH